MTRIQVQNLVFELLIIARSALSVRGAGKSDVRPSVRSSVRSFVRSFVRKIIGFCRKDLEVWTLLLSTGSLNL